MPSASLPFTSVVSYHINEFGCGVARFGKQLAERLGVPFVPLAPDPKAWGAFPLLSLKWSELTENDRTYTRYWCVPDWRSSSAETMRTARPRTYGVFWHDAGSPFVTEHAQRVFYADPLLGSPGLWCPSLLTPSRPRTVKLFSFGMAHKLQTPYYAKVRQLLDAAGLRYHLRVSVGLHEGTSLSDATQHFDALKDIMGPEHVTILGILSDDAVSEELHSADYVLAFFTDGVRLNNTTVHAALEAGRPVISNGTLMLWGLSDIEEMTHWPRPAHVYNWDNLISAMRKECDTSRLPTAS